MTRAGQDILEGAQAALEYIRGDKTKGRAHAIIHSVVDVKAIRKNTGMTQEVFADTYGLSLSSLKKWESGIRTPEGPAKAYLTVIGQRPELVKEALWSAV